MSAVPPPPVDLTRSSLRVLVARQEEVLVPMSSRPVAAEPRGSAGLAFLGFGALCGVAAGLGSLVTARGKSFAWYRALSKPSYTPPDQAFGIVWPVLYGLAAGSAARVWSRGEGNERREALALWGTQLAFNGAWTPIFFGAHRPRLALADLALTFVSLAAYARKAARIDRAAALMVAPYLAWLGFAGAVNAGVVRKNRGIFGRLFARG